MEALIDLYHSPGGYSKGFFVGETVGECQGIIIDSSQKVPSVNVNPGVVCDNCPLSPYCTESISD